MLAAASERATSAGLADRIACIHADVANPMFAPPNARRRRYRLADPQMRFWFRFVLPYQPQLGSGLRPGAHYARNIRPRLPEHVAVAFEDICREWVRARFTESTDAVGSWWGPARHDLRRTGARTSEEIDIVGASGTTATVLGECKWTARPMGFDVLNDLRSYKVPALAQAGVDTQEADVVLFSRSGFSDELHAEAARGGVHLIGLEDLLTDLAQ